MNLNSKNPRTHLQQPAAERYFTNKQPMKSGATTSAGRQKKAWGRDENFLEMRLVPIGTIKKRP